MNRPLTPRSGEPGVVESAGFLMMAEPQIGPIFSPLPHGGEGQGEGEESFRSKKYVTIFMNHWTWVACSWLQARFAVKAIGAPPRRSPPKFFSSQELD